MSARTLSAAIAVASCAAPAFAIAVFENSSAHPDNAYVGRWNGGSAVAIGQRFIITAAHNRGNLRDSFLLGGVEYGAAAIHRHASADLMLIELDTDLPGHHELASGAPGVGDRVLVAGTGLTASASEDGVAGWTGRRGSLWGTNDIAAATGRHYEITFDADAGGTEAIFTRFDSGGGLFVEAEDGSIRLAGLAIGASSRPGATSIGDTGYALRLDRFSGFLNRFDLEGVGYDTPGTGAAASELLARLAPAPGFASLALPAAAFGLLLRRR